MAATICKTIDAQGRVSYSQRPSGVGCDKVMQLPGAQTNEPSESAREPQGPQPHPSSHASSDSAHPYQRAAIAKERVKELEEPKAQDWQYDSDGTRVLTRAYLDRLQQAQKELRAALNALPQTPQAPPSTEGRPWEPEP